MQTTLLVDASVNQTLFCETLPITIPTNPTITVAEIDAAVRQQSPLSALTGLTRVSPQPALGFVTLNSLPRSTTGSVGMSWDAPPTDRYLMTLIESLSREVEQLKTTQEKDILPKLRDVKTTQEKDVLPRLDYVPLRCLLDVFIFEQGFKSGDGPRGAWVAANKHLLSQASGIPEDDMEVFLQDFRDLGDNSAHTFCADEVARAINRIPNNQTDQARFKALFQQLITHSVEQELDEDNEYTTHLYGGKLPTPGDRVRRVRKVL